MQILHRPNAMRTNLAIFAGKRGGMEAMSPMAQILHDKGHKVTLFVCRDLLHDDACSINMVRDKIVNVSWRKMEEALDHLSECKVAFIYGDRMETVIAASLCKEMGIPIVHLQSGDISGGVDDTFRKAVEQLADFLLTPNLISYRRVGANISDRRIRVVGDHHRDHIAAQMQEGIEKERLCIIHMHPDTLMDAEYNRDLMDNTIAFAEGMTANGWEIRWLPPCSDRFWECMIAPSKFYQPMMSGKEYVYLMQRAALFVGNSSSLIYEVDMTKTFGLLIGGRQGDREEEVFAYGGMVVRYPEDLPRCVKWFEGEELPKLVRCTNSEVCYRGPGNARELTIKFCEEVGLI